jgi:prolyl-tRNA synthetase
MAPKHVVILPVLRDESQRAATLEYCQRVKAELEAQVYDGEPVRVAIDDRDIGGGDKKWQHVKRGVPFRIEVGAREVEGDQLFVARRDGGKPSAVPRAEFVADISHQLAAVQRDLFQKALAFREEHTTAIDSLDEFKAYFTPKNAENPEIHAGFASCRFVECEEMDAVLKDLKVTPRCIPLEGAGDPGPCLFSGKPATKRAIFAKAY